MLRSYLLFLTGAIFLLSNGLDAISNFERPSPCSLQCRADCVTRGFLGGFCVPVGPCVCHLDGKIVGAIENLVGPPVEEKPSSTGILPYFPSDFYDPYDVIPRSKLMAYPLDQRASSEKEGLKLTANGETPLEGGGQEIPLEPQRPAYAPGHSEMPETLLLQQNDEGQPSQEPREQQLQYERDPGEEQRFQEPREQEQQPQYKRDPLAEGQAFQEPQLSREQEYQQQYGRHEGVRGQRSWSYPVPNSNQEQDDPYVGTMSADAGPKLKLAAEDVKREETEELGIIIGNPKSNVGEGQKVNIMFESNSTTMIKANETNLHPELDNPQATKAEDKLTGDRNIKTDSSGKYIEGDAKIEVGNTATGGSITGELENKIVKDKKRKKRDLRKKIIGLNKKFVIR